MKKLIIMFILICFWISGVSANELAANAEGAYLIEYSSGKVLYSKNANERLYPASMTKMMSLYLIFEAINNGKLKLDDMIVVSEHAASMGGSQIWLQVNEQMSVNDLLKAVCVASANDAVVALAEKVSGSEEMFVSQMNTLAQEWGLTDTHFMNASGLHDDDHYSTVKDMSVIGSKLIGIGGDLLTSYTTLYDSYVREGEAAVWLVNTNKLLRTLKGVDGLKTGYTSQAGYCICISTVRDGIRLIGVLMKEDSNKVRDKEIKELIEYGYSLFKTKKIYSANDLIECIEIEDGKPNKLEVKIKDDLYLNYIENDTYQSNINYYINAAPILIDEEIGSIEIISGDGMKSKGTLLAMNDINKLEYFDYVVRIIKKMLY